MLAALCKRMQQLPTISGFVVHRGKDTPCKTLETMCAPTMLEELSKQIQHYCATLRRSRNKRNVESCWLKQFDRFQTLRNNSQQHATTCNGQYCCVCLQGALLLQQLKGLEANLAAVVQKVDSTIHRINHYPLDKYLVGRAGFIRWIVLSTFWTSGVSTWLIPVQYWLPRPGTCSVTRSSHKWRVKKERAVSWEDGKNLLRVNISDIQ